MAEVAEDTTAFELDAPLDELAEADNPDFDPARAHKNIVREWQKKLTEGKNNPLVQFKGEPSTAQLEAVKASLQQQLSIAKRPVAFRLRLANGETIQFNNELAQGIVETHNAAMAVTDFDVVDEEGKDGIQVIEGQDFTGLNGDQILARLEGGGNGTAKKNKPRLVQEDEEEGGAEGLLARLKKEGFKTGEEHDREAAAARKEARKNMTFMQKLPGVGRLFRGGAKKEKKDVKPKKEYSKKN